MRYQTFSLKLPSEIIMESALNVSTSLKNRTPSTTAWFSFHVFMRLIFTNIIMQHTSHSKWLHRHPSEAQGPSHCHHGDSRTPLWHRHNRAHWKSVTLQLHPNFHSVSVMFLEWNCLSGLAPLKPIIVLRPVGGWPAGLTCHSCCLTHSPKPHMSKTANHISLLGCSHLVSSFLIGSPGWLLWQQSISSLLEVALTNHNTSVHLTVSAHLTHTHTHMHKHMNTFIFLSLLGPHIDLMRFDLILLILNLLHSNWRNNMKQVYHQKCVLLPK